MISRRALLGTGAAAAVLTLAGCSDSQNGTEQSGGSNTSQDETQQAEDETQPENSGLSDRDKRSVLSWYENGIEAIRTGEEHLETGRSKEGDRNMVARDEYRNAVDVFRTAQSQFDTAAYNIPEDGADRLRSTIRDATDYAAYREAEAVATRERLKMKMIGNTGEARGLREEIQDARANADGIDLKTTDQLETILDQV